MLDTDKIDIELYDKEHYKLVVDVFNTGECPATAVVLYADLKDALSVYLSIFLQCDFVRRCTIIKHVPHVPKLFYLASFTRSKEFKNFLPLPLDKSPYYVYNKSILGYLFEEINILEV